MAWVYDRDDGNAMGGVLGNRLSWMTAAASETLSNGQLEGGLSKGPP